MTCSTAGSTGSAVRDPRPGGVVVPGRVGAGLAALLTAVVLSSGIVAQASTAVAPTGVGSARLTGASATTWQYRELRNPARVQVLDGGAQPVATFTRNARTVTLRGASRVFSEASTTTTQVVSTTWVRLLPSRFDGTVDRAWLTAALADTSPDVLAVAMEYVTGAPVVRDGAGLLVSSDADYGPVQADGTREEGSDFNDYLGIRWSYDTRTDLPETDQAGALDCSGFVRMVLGHRLGVPLGLETDGVRLPRRAVQMLQSAPGLVTIPDTGVRPSSTSRLAPGDLLFFDGSRDDGTAVDHVGIYLGPDTTGAPRFVSSRKTVNGPTMGDVGGRSVISGSGYYADAWRAARRL